MHGFRLRRLLNGSFHYFSYDIAGNKGLLFSFNYFADVVWPVYREIAVIIREN